MNRKLLVLIPCLLAVAAAALFIRLSDVTSLIVRAAAGVDLAEKGIALEYQYIAPGLRQKPYILPFSHSIKKFSRDAVNIDVINTYTVGGYDKDPGSRMRGVSNFLDPTSKFKDSWFGVYLVMDDTRGRARRFMLNDPELPPDDIYNLNTESLLELTRLDQAVVVHTSHQGQDGYDFDSFMDSFPFKKIEESEHHEAAFDRVGGTWLKITASFTTVSAVTDISRTKMNYLSSIRAFVGLPSREVYSLVDPWHRTVLTGSTLARYFSCPQGGFWAVVYYNGTAFRDKNGRQIDTWNNTDIRNEFEKMFMRLEIGCAQQR